MDIKQLAEEFGGLLKAVDDQIAAMEPDAAKLHQKMEDARVELAAHVVKRERLLEARNELMRNYQAARAGGEWKPTPNVVSVPAATVKFKGH